ncbi:hypothetical protein RUM44_005148 [Polyplax serrata]|uniref:Uncharacterized protein n=1 Tax=Polyplax serrata TaxID=468196 RepID=A0ABR1AE75_POLSC
MEDGRYLRVQVMGKDSWIYSWRKDNAGHQCHGPNVGACVALEVSSRNASWVTMGLIGGLLYGFCTSDENNTGGKMLTCAILGGTLMGIMGNILMWVDIVEPPDHLTEEHNNTLHMYSA